MEKQAATATLSVLAEGEYTVTVSEKEPRKIQDLLEDLGISNRNGQYYLDGRPTDAGTTLLPGSEAVVLPHIRGG